MGYNIDLKFNSMVDAWVTRQPHEPDPVKTCENCDFDLFEDDTAYEIDDKVYCEDCAKEKAAEWLDNHKITLYK